MHHILVAAFQALFLHLLLLTAATRLPLVHRDHILPSSHEATASRFEARMKRDAMRVGSLTRGRRLAANEVSGFETGVQNISNEYYAVVGVGTPPQNLTLLIDAGSDLLWVNCTEEFHRTSSSSYADVGCGDLTCTVPDGDEYRRGCDSNLCSYNFTYGNLLQTSGTLAMENIAIGNTTVQHVPIGCSLKTNGLDNIPSADGMLGLGGGHLSIMNQLAGFSYCLGNPNTGGWLEFWNETVPRDNGSTWARLDNNPYEPSLYYIDVVNISVGGEVLDNISLQLDPNTGDSGMILDTATAVTLLANGAYEKLRDKFKEKMRNYTLAVDYRDTLLDTCYNIQEDGPPVVVPTILFNISARGLDPPFITFDAKNSLVVVDNNNNFTCCLAFARSNSSLSVLGSMQQQGSQITIDGLGFVGFGPGFC